MIAVMIINTMFSNRFCVLFGLLLAISLALCNTGPISEEVRTKWFKVPSAGLYKPVIDEETGESIRSAFKESDHEVVKDITHQKSPAFELAYTDTGDDTYLDKKTIKHSLTDLSSLTKTKKLLGEKILSCNAIKEGPKLFFPTCPGDLVVITIAGSMKMTCNEIEKRVFFGPVTIKSISCQQSFVFDMECLKKQTLNIKDQDCRDSSYEALLITISILFGVSTLVLMIIVLWIIGIHRGVKINGKRVPLTRKGCYYEMCYNEYVDGEGKKAYSLIEDPSNINMQHKKIRKHWLLLLVTFLICRPLHVQSYELLESYDSTILKYNYRLVLGDSEIVKFGSGGIKRDPVVHTSILTKLFTTAKWKLNTKEEYFCQWFKCEAVSVCGMGMLPFIKIGDLAQKIFNFKVQNHSFYSCQKLQGYCAFGNGCKLVAFEVMLDDQEIYSVYSIGVGGSHGGEVVPPTGCIIDNVIDKSTGIFDSHLLLTNPKGKTYLCHKDLFSAKPEMGMLGDLQITEEGSFHFASNEVRCVADHNDRAICRYGNSFIGSIQSLCEDIDHTYFKTTFNIEKRVISWKQSGEAIITMRCDRRLPLKSTNGSCVNIEIRVWEIAHLDSHLLLSFRANSVNELGVFKFPKLVHMNGHSFLCNGEPQFTELYDLQSLNSLGINYSMTSIPYSSLDPIQEDHFSDKDPDDGWRATIFNRLAASAPFWGLSTTTILIIVVLFILCIKK